MTREIKIAEVGVFIFTNKPYTFLKIVIRL